MFRGEFNVPYQAMNAIIPYVNVVTKMVPSEGSSGTAHCPGVYTQSQLLPVARMLLRWEFHHPLISCTIDNPDNVMQGIGRRVDNSHLVL